MPCVWRLGELLGHTSWTNAASRVWYVRLHRYTGSDEQQVAVVRNRLQVSSNKQWIEQDGTVLYYIPEQHRPDCRYL